MKNYKTLSGSGSGNVKRKPGRPRLYPKRKPVHSKVKYNLEERFGDREARREHNLVQPYITELPASENREMVPYNSTTGRTRGQLWSVIWKQWLRFRIAKNRTADIDAMYDAAKIIRRTQKELAIHLTEFTEPFYLTGQELSPEEVQEEGDGIR